MDINTIKAKSAPILKKLGVSKAAVFGSVARQEDTQQSDIDILVDFQKKFTLFDLSELKIELEEALGKKVDLVTYQSIHPKLKKQILSQQKILYE